MSQHQKDRSPLSLKWLEAFQATARTGSLRRASAHLGISISTVSHHLSCLERTVGVGLIDHGKRPMRVTKEGEILLRRVDEAMERLRRGLAEIWSEDLSTYSRVVRFAMIEDFETTLGPKVADRLSAALPSCALSFLSRSSHEILDLLQTDQVDIGIASETDSDIPGVSGTPLLRDPYVLVLPKGATPPASVAHLVRLNETLPMLRYNKRLLMGRRIEAHLRRLHIRLPLHMEFESTQAIMALVAEGRGWAVTTALNYARAERYHQGVQPARFPEKGFTRELSIFMRDDLPAPLQGLVDGTVRDFAQSLVVAPTVAQSPWLTDDFRLIPDPRLPETDGGPQAL